ncbi:MAG: glycosyltransferase [Crocosphaera sp.]|nr:glycosyltransferase [Crocosphaera sp.]
MNFLPSISVIIPVYNDGIRLKKCLEALENQSYASDNYEVIVIDNASDEQQNIKGIVNQFSHAHYTYEAKPGSYAARNKGLSLAKGNILAFTDADCIPTYNWLENGVNALLSHPNCGLVGGKIELFFRNPQKPNSIELYETVTAFPQAKLLAEYHGAATANVFTYRHIFDEVGLFDESLKSNGDLEWGSRVYQHKYEQTYAENARVFHPARYSWSQLYQRTIRLAGGYYLRQQITANSTLSKLKLFIESLIKNSVPPINFFVNTFKSSDLLKIQDKIKVCLAMTFVRYVTLIEIINLKIGKKTARV